MPFLVKFAFWFSFSKVSLIKPKLKQFYEVGSLSQTDKQPHHKLREMENIKAIVP